MADERLLTVRDVSSLLGVSEKEVLDLAESGKLPAYKVGGVYLRFKREQLESYRKSHTTPLLHKSREKENYTLREKLSDFLYFNDFYIFSVVAIVLIILIIFRG